MWSIVSWQKLKDPEIAKEVEDLRQSTIQYLIRLTLVGFILWHFASLIVGGHRPDPTASTIRHWALFPIIVFGLIGVGQLSRRRTRFASVAFLGFGVLAITAATGILHSPEVTHLYPLVALTAVVIMHPLAGILVSVFAAGTLAILQQVGTLFFLQGDQILETALLSLLAVAIAWTLGRNLLTAVDWSLSSYAEARKNAEDARQQRARLVQALRQLDVAYYNLQQANAALEVAWKAAEAAERGKSEFVTNISHELRTPLNLIAGFSEVILTAPESYPEPLPASFRGDLNAIFRSAQHLLMLTTDVIDLARVGAGRLALAREPIDLEQTIRDASDIVREFIETKGLRLRIEVSSALPLLSVDRLRVRQVLLNLLTNAARFTSQGSINVTATLEGDFVLVKVSDSGKGIAPGELDRVFDDFYSGSSSGPTSPGGLGGFGLGLPLSKRFIEMHGGQMGVESIIGRGTTFWFTLPILTLEGGTDEAAWRSSRLTAPAGVGGHAVILVSPDRWLAQFLQQHLRGYRVVPAADRSSAVHLAAEFRATAIIQDHRTDSLDGELAGPVPVLQVPLPRSDRLAAELGVAAYLVKPVTRSQLREAIGRLNRSARSILIVDDDDRFDRLLMRMLQSPSQPLAQDIRIAHNGRDALEQLARERPDLILLDLSMPELRGEELIAELKQTPAWAEIPVIIISGQDQVDHRLRLGGPIAVDRKDGFLLEELLGTVEAMLGSIRVRSI